MPTVVETFNLALQHHQAGRLQEAEALYRQILQAQADHPDALHLLGVIAHQGGKHDVAVEYITRAIVLNPTVAEYHSNIGEAYRALGRLNEAEASLRQALALKPASAEAVNNLGAVLQAQGKLEEAVTQYRQALALKPGYAQAHNNLGSALLAQWKVEEAATHFRQALALNPSYAGAHNNLGIVLQQEGLTAEAIAQYRQALLHDRTLAEAHANLGSALQEQDRTQEAVEAYRQAIAVNPAYADAYSILGNALKKQSKPDEAAQAYQQALALQPGDGTRIKLATILPVIIGSTRELTAIRRKFEKNISALLKEKLTLSDPAREVGQTNFHLAYHGLNDRALQVKIAQLYERACPSLLYTAPHCRPSARIEKAGKVKIGFISRYLFSHSVALTARGLMAELTKEQFAKYVFCVPPVQKDQVSALVRQSVDHAVVLPGSLAAARERIAEARLDILVYLDIGMEPLTYFLAFARLAPVQCVFAGHPVTTGIRTMDYFISSEVLEPAGADAHYSERLVRLKFLPAYYHRPEIPDKRKALREFGLDERRTIYLCPQALFKVHPDFDEVMAGILRADPRGEVVLVEVWEKHWVDLLKARFERTVPDVADRIRFLARLSTDDFLQLLAAVPVVLDTLHFGGGTTSLMSLAMGTPVVTLPGQFMRGRGTYACYKQMGMMDCVAKSPAQYVKTAVRLGTDCAFREATKQKILARNHVLYENHAVVREFERFFLRAIKQARSQKIGEGVACLS